MTRYKATDVEGERYDRINPEHRRMFAKACNLINRCLEEVQEYIPTAEYYLACDTMHLMTGPSHEGRGCGVGQVRQDRIALSGHLPGADGGDW